MGKTSSAVKQKYNSRVYRQVKVELSRELVDIWESELKIDGISKAEFFRNAMAKYLAEKGIVIEKPGE